MKQLLENIEANFDEAEGLIRIIGSQWSDVGLTLSLSVQMHDESAPELWTINCEGVVEERIDSRGPDVLRFGQQSPLLKVYKERETDVFFFKNAMRPELLFGIVCSCCIEGTGTTESIGRFVNAEPTSTGICSSEFGLLGRFPESVAAEISSRLKSQPIVLTVQDIGLPQYWDGERYQPYPDSLSVLEIGLSCVIAASFDSVRV